MRRLQPRKIHPFEEYRNILNYDEIPTEEIWADSKVLWVLNNRTNFTLWILGNDVSAVSCQHTGVSWNKVGLTHLDKQGIQIKLVNRALTNRPMKTRISKSSTWFVQVGMAPCYQPEV